MKNNFKVQLKFKPDMGHGELHWGKKYWLVTFNSSKIQARKSPSSLSKPGTLCSHDERFYSQSVSLFSKPVGT